MTWVPRKSVILIDLDETLNSPEYQKTHKLLQRLMAKHASGYVFTHASFPIPGSYTRHLKDDHEFDLPDGGSGTAMISCTWCGLPFRASDIQGATNFVPCQAARPSTSTPSPSNGPVVFTPVPPPNPPQPVSGSPHTVDHEGHRFNVPSGAISSDPIRCQYCSLIWTMLELVVATQAGAIPFSRCICTPPSAPTPPLASFPPLNLQGAVAAHNGAWGGKTPLEIKIEVAFAEAASQCECGSFKAMGIQKGMAGHSDWCPWSK